MDQPTALCECGCGQPAPIARRTATQYGWVKGRPLRFVKGHSRKLVSRQLLLERLPTDGPEGACWEWGGPTNKKGYGTGANGVFAHRLAYERARGPIPHGLLVCHTCDNPPCCNPSHLFLGTTQDNADDMVAKGRSQVPAHRKLTAEQVIEIRARCAAGGVTKAALAREYGISEAGIGMVVRRETYRRP